MGDGGERERALDDEFNLELMFVFQKAKLHSPKRLVQFQLIEKLTRV